MPVEPDNAKPVLDYAVRPKPVVPTYRKVLACIVVGIGLSVAAGGLFFSRGDNRIVLPICGLWTAFWGVAIGFQHIGLYASKKSSSIPVYRKVLAGLLITAGAALVIGVAITQTGAARHYALEIPLCLIGVGLIIRFQHVRLW